MCVVALMLPAELKLYMATFCTPSSLATLAQVHTSYQVQAERELYQNTAIYADSLVLDTLRNRPHKAGLVRSLTIELSPRSGTADNDAEVLTATSLCDMLCSMHSLMDLRIRMPDYKDTPWAAQINQVLCAKNFKLHTLYCDQYLDIPNIIVKQSRLQLFGLYGGCGYFGAINPLENILRATLELNSPRPTFFVLDLDSSVYIFPELSTDLLYPWKLEALTDSFDKDVARAVQSSRHTIFAVRIFLRDFSDMAFVQAVVEGMVQCFPDVKELTFVIRRSPQMHSYSDLVPLLSSIPLLDQVVFWFWWDLVGDISEVISDAELFALSRECYREYRKAIQIGVLEGTLRNKGDRDQVWKIFGEDY